MFVCVSKAIQDREREIEKKRRTQTDFQGKIFLFRMQIENSTSKSNTNK